MPSAALRFQASRLSAAVVFVAALVFLVRELGSVVQYLLTRTLPWGKEMRYQLFRHGEHLYNFQGLWAYRPEGGRRKAAGGGQGGGAGAGRGG